MTEQEKLLGDVGRILDNLDIRYVVTGGIAVTVWGRPRFTADIDIAIELLPKKVDQLASALLKIDKDVYVDREMMRHALIEKGEFNFINPASGLKVDFFVLKGSRFDKEEIARCVRKKIAGVWVSLISPEDLIIRKLLWHRESGSDRQLEDVESILKRQKKLDRGYLKKWAKYHSVFALLETLWKKTKR